MLGALQSNAPMYVGPFIASTSAILADPNE